MRPNRIGIMAILTLLFALALVSNAATSAAQELAAKQEVRIGAVSGDIGTLDPHGPVIGADYGPIQHIYGALVRTPIGDSLGDYQPYLAESWEVSADSKIWTFKLKKGVEWHNDFGEVTAEDVAYSFNRVMKGKTSKWTGDYASFNEVKALDPYTVQFTTKGPDAYFLSKVSIDYGGYIVCKKAVEKADAFDSQLKPNAQQIVGFGPFAFESYKSKVGVVLKRNDDFLGGKPIIEKLTYKFIPESGARELALINGEVEAILGLYDSKWLKYMVESGAVLEPQGPKAVHAIYFNLTQKPFDNKKVRQAFYHATGQEPIIQMQGDLIAQACTSPVLTGVEGHIDAGWAEYKHDPAKAKKLLAEAGFPDGFKTKMFIHKGWWYYDKIVLYQNLLKNVGIDLELMIVDIPVYYEKIRQDLNPVVIWGTKYPLPTQWLRRYYHSDSIVGKPTAMLNFSHFSNPKVDELIEIAEVTMDKQKRIAAIEEAQKIIVNELVSFPCAEIDFPKLRNKWFDLGYTPKNTHLDTYEVGVKTRILKH